MLKRGICLAAAAIFTATSVSAAPWVTMKITYNYKTYGYSAEAVYVNVNGNKLTNLPMQPILLSNTTLVPAREVCEAFGAIVDWKKATEEIYIACGDSIVTLKVNSKTAYVNGAEKQLTVPALIINNKTMIPVRFVSEAFNKDVVWSNPERTIYIKDKVTETPAQTQTAAPTPTTNVFDQNFMYDSVNKTIVAKKTNDAFDAAKNNVSYTDGDKTLTIAFDGDLGGSIKTGEYNVGTNGVNSISYSNAGGKSAVTVKSDSKLTPKVESDKTYIYITLV